MSAVRDRMQAIEAARKFWNGLDNAARWQLGDDLVLGEFDWRDWFDKKPEPAFMNELDQLRMHWEAAP